MPNTPVWEQYGLTEGEWSALSEQDKEKLTGLNWTSKPCKICGKAVSVLDSHEGDTWCLEHAGKWGKEGGGVV